MREKRLPPGLARAASTRSRAKRSPPRALSLISSLPRITADKQGRVGLGWRPGGGGMRRRRVAAGVGEGDSRRARRTVAGPKLLSSSRRCIWPVQVTAGAMGSSHRWEGRCRARQRAEARRVAASAGGIGGGDVRPSARMVSGGRTRMRLEARLPAQGVRARRPPIHRSSFVSRRTVT
jgi:hypothetical protein